jgi:sterol desaturase/sphingolipid hydroxylase (fatty acid hydroxylase superfamily)
MHWNHHSPMPEHTNSNYGVVLSCWDRAFATLTAPAADPARFGLDALHSPGWQSAFGMLATPWRARLLRRL